MTLREKLKRARQTIRQLRADLAKCDDLILAADIKRDEAIKVADENRTRRLALEQEFELMGYKHIARRKRTKIMVDYGKARAKNWRARGIPE